MLGGEGGGVKNKITMIGEFSFIFKKERRKKKKKKSALRGVACISQTNSHQPTILLTI